MTRPDQQPGFWNEYEAPRSEIAALLQQPAHKITAETVAGAYMADYRKDKRNERRP